MGLLITPPVGLEKDHPSGVTTIEELLSTTLHDEEKYSSSLWLKENYSTHPRKM